MFLHRRFFKKQRGQVTSFCYSSFTSKYLELGLMPPKHYKKQTTVYFFTSGDHSKRTFERASTQLVPIRVIVCKLLLRMTSFHGFVSFVFFSIENSINAEPAVRFLLTVLSVSLPKIIEIFQSAEQKNIKARKLLMAIGRS